MRVIHGTMEIANQASTITRGLRRRGIEAATVSYYQSYLGYRADFEYPLQQKANAPERDADLTRIAEAAAADFDTFHFWFSTSFTLDYSDLPLLTSGDRQVFMQHCGSDVRTLDVAKAMNKWAVVKNIPPEVIHAQLTRISEHVDTAIVGETRLYEYIKQYYRKVHMVPVAIDLSTYPFVGATDQNEKPVIVHAPTSPMYKGTKHVLEVIERIRGKVPFEFKLVQGVSHEEAKRIYMGADIILDQFLGGGYGGLSMECMALGKTVLVWVCDAARVGYPEEVPVIPANPDTLEKQLLMALGEPGLRKALGERGRAYVERYHDCERIADTMLAIYRGDGVDDAPFQTWW